MSFGRVAVLAGALLIGPAAWAADPPAPLVPGPKDRCAVCGMFVEKYPNFLAQLVLGDGSTAYFDGVKDMMRYLRDPGRFGGAAREARAVFVKDYYSLETVDGREAHYVAGSDVLGPMGKELIPFRTREAAEEFKKDHKGKRVLRFGEIDEGVLAELQ